MARYRNEGDHAFELQSRAPVSGDADTHRDVVDKSSTVTGELLRELTIDTSKDYQPRK